MLELYHNDMSVCAEKVRFVLAEKGLKWKGHHLNLRAGDQQKPEYLKLNPNAVVPTLVDDGRVIIESTVINEYLDDAYPESALRPADPLTRARMRLWTKQLDEGVHAATGVLSTAIAFRYQKLAMGSEKLEIFLNKMPDPAKRERNRDTIFKGIDSIYFAGAIQRFDKLLGDMEKALAQGPWLAGEDFSLADIGYAPYLTRLDHLQLQSMWDRRPRLVDWYEQIKTRPGYKTGIGEWLNQSYLTLLQEKGKEAQPRVKEILKAA